MGIAYRSTLGEPPTGNAVVGDVLYGKTFSNADGTDKVGTMPNNGAVAPTALDPGGSYTIPAGYHNGQGAVSAKSNTATYTANTRGAALDMGAANLNRYVNTNGVPNSNSGTYTFPVNDTGGTKDLGETNNYRYVNAQNVYNKGKADGASAGHGSFNDASAGQTITINLGFNPKAVYLKHTGANGRHFVVSYDNNYNSSNFELLDERGSGIGTYTSITLGGTSSEGYNISFNVTNNGFTFKSNSGYGTAGTWYYCASN